MYTNLAFGTAKSVLFIKVSSFQDVGIPLYTCTITITITLHSVYTCSKLCLMFVCRYVFDPNKLSENHEKNKENGKGYQFYHVKYLMGVVFCV